VEHVCHLEDSLDHIKKGMWKILTQSQKFWKEFDSFQQVNLGSFKKELEDIVNMKTEVLQKWEDLQDYI